MTCQDEATLLIAILFAQDLGKIQQALERAETLVRRIMVDPPKVDDAGIVAIAAAQLMAKHPDLDEAQCIHNAKTLYGFIQQRSRDRIRQILEKASAASAAVSQPDGYSGKGGLTE